MSPIRAPIVEQRTRSADGTEITYYRVGRGPRVWLMPPAMGAPLLAMKYVLEHFQDQYTFVTWDMRGFYQSGIPSNTAAYRVDDHLDDLIAVRDAAKLNRFVLGGWSMSVQLSLEYYHRRPDDVRALVLINGPFERVLDTVLPVRGAETLFAPLLRVGRSMGPVLNRASRAVLGARGASRALERVGILARNPEFFETVLAEFCALDWPRYLTVVEHLHAHSAAPYLAEVTVPTLITAGTRDWMTPVRLAERMHAAIRGSELALIEGGTHYTVAEFPAELNAKIEHFLDRVERTDANASPATPSH